MANIRILDIPHGQGMIIEDDDYTIFFLNHSCDIIILVYKSPDKYTMIVEDIDGGYDSGNIDAAFNKANYKLVINDEGKGKTYTFACEEGEIIDGKQWDRLIKNLQFNNEESEQDVEELIRGPLIIEI